MLSQKGIPKEYILFSNGTDLINNFMILKEYYLRWTTSIGEI